MKSILNYFVYASFIISPLFCYSQKKIELTVHFPPNIDYSKISIQYDNGQSRKSIKPILNNNTFILSDSCYSHYAAISFCYPDSTEKDGIPCSSFFLNEKPAMISFYHDSLSKKNPFREFKTVNAITFTNMGEAEFSKFVAAESKDAKNFYNSNKDSFSQNEKLLTTLNEKLEKVSKKKLEFIKLNPNSYYSLWIFSNELAGGRHLKADSLLQFYNQVFPDSLKQTYEGREIVKKMNGRINTKRGGEAPGFNAKDIKGNVISLRNLRGKYILLDFWASWCGPCIRLTPSIKEIRNKYSKDKLEIISVTLDNNYNEFQTALKKANTNWIQIFNDHDLINKYAIAPIPQIYLIDPNGVVIYNMEQENDYQLEKLKQALTNI